jgi:hypothetical protein
MSTQHGLITTRQMIKLGHRAEVMARWVRTGHLVSVRRGVYTEPATWEAWDEFRDRPLARARAAHYVMRTDHVMSHDSAALELDMPILSSAPELIHVTRPDVHGSRTTCGVKHHTAVFRKDQVVTLGGIDVLDPARTAVDIAREHGFAEGVVACDSALRLGVPRSALHKAYEPMWCWRHVTVVRAAVELADGRAESVGESLLRILVAELGVGPVQPQFELVIDGRLQRCDLRVGRHIFEFDGKAKYQRLEQGGFATKDPGEVVWDEKKRQDKICGIGLGMSRVIWSDLWGDERSRTSARLGREYAATEARYGTSLSDIAAYLPRRSAA